MDDDLWNWDFQPGFPQEEGNVAPEGDDALLPADFGLGDAAGFEAGESSLFRGSSGRLIPQSWQPGLDRPLGQHPATLTPRSMPQQHLTQPLSLASNPSFSLNAQLPNHGNGPPQSLFCNPFNAESLVDSKFSQSIFPEYGNLSIPTDLFSELFCPGGNDIPPAPSASTYQTSAEGDGQRARYEVMENADNLHVAEPTLIEDSRLRDGYVAIEGGYICTFPHCKVKHVFKRKFELQRHMLIHVRKKSFNCPVDSCNRRGRYTFYRDDKRKAHLKSRHTDDDYVTCPVSGCPAGPLQLDLLRFHLFFHGRFFNSDTVKLLKTYAEGGQKCPVQKCRQTRWLTSDQLAGKKGHLISHNEADRISQASTLREKGFGIQGEVICPMCGMPSSDTAEFCKHMENEHILTDHGKAYVEAVRSAGSDLFWRYFSGHPF